MDEDASSSGIKRRRIGKDVNLSSWEDPGLAEDPELSGDPELAAAIALSKMKDEADELKVDEPDAALDADDVMGSDDDMALAIAMSLASAPAPAPAPVSALAPVAAAEELPCLFIAPSCTGLPGCEACQYAARP